jgi:hypothetical protein
MERTEAKLVCLFIKDLLIPRIVPFDSVTARIRNDFYGYYFELEFLFNPIELEQAKEPEGFHAIWERHDQEWLIRLIEYFSDLAELYGLNWNSEYQDGITDTLYRNFNKDEEGVTQLSALIKDFIALYVDGNRSYSL